MGAKKIKAPQRSYLGEMQSALTAQEGIQSQLLGLEGEYTPQYQALQEAGFTGGIQSLGNLYRNAGEVSAGLQTDYLGMQAPIYGQLGEAARGAYQQSLDPATRGLYNSMMQSAQEDITAGRNLTPQQQQAAQQSARQAMAARGLTGNQAVAQEVMNTYQMQNAREDRARQFAGNMYNTGAQQTANAMSMYGNPMMQQMSSASPSALASGGGNLYAGLGAKLFQPESQYNAAIEGFNAQALMSARMANQQASNGLTSSLIGAAGTIGGAMMGNPALFGASTASSGLGSLSSGMGYGSALSTSQMAGGFNTSLGAGGSNLNFSSGAMYKF